MKTSPWKREEYVMEGPEFPATYVTWDDCAAFCDRAGLRLPSEAEWEYACRAGTETAFTFADDADDLGTYAWFSGNTMNQDERYPHGVGMKKPNAFGLYDMLGNVWEWCHDRYGNYPSGPIVDPTGQESGSNRVLRGVSWYSDPRLVRSATRFRYNKDYASLSRGFRVVVSSWTPWL